MQPKYNSKFSLWQKRPWTQHKVVTSMHLQFIRITNFTEVQRRLDIHIYMSQQWNNFSIEFWKGNESFKGLTLVKFTFLYIQCLCKPFRFPFVRIVKKDWKDHYSNIWKLIFLLNECVQLLSTINHTLQILVALLVF